MTKLSLSVRSIMQSRSVSLQLLLVASAYFNCFGHAIASPLQRRSGTCEQTSVIVLLVEVFFVPPQRDYPRLKSFPAYQSKILVALALRASLLL